MPRLPLPIDRSPVGSLVLLLTWLLLPGASRAAGEASPEGIAFFEQRIRPLLVNHCTKCHGADPAKRKGGLRLDTREGTRQGGESGPALVPGEPERSLLVKAVRQTDESLRMPPGKKLAPNEVAEVEKWIRMGAPDPRQGDGLASTKPALSLEAARRFWSFQPVRDPALPAVRDTRWPRTPVDQFLLARLEAHGMRPAPEADRRTLLRRVTYDLTGLPPTPEEIDAFLADHRPEAFTLVVDRLLASPQYGEKWGRHWLDLVRYADTSGCNADVPVPEAYRYRNYVIEAFNRDKPYDQFIREQLAGDLLPSRSEAQRHEQIIATGYLAIARRFSSLGEEFHLTLEDCIDNIGKTFLGLSINCARCHDHKYDPLTSKDYYALYGILASTRFAFPGTEIPRHSRDFVPLVSHAEYRAVIEPFHRKMDALDEEIRTLYARKVALDTGAERDKADRAYKAAVVQRDELLKQGPRYPRAYAVSEGKPANAHIQKKGDPANLGDEVPRRFLELLGGQTLPVDEKGSGRRQLAEWLTDPRNPLTARVLVNRLWQHHFGHGLVRTPNDFGARGQPPTHPELLDWLATRFVESGWSIKAMHRLLVLSSAYRMASSDNPVYAQRDPNNELLWRFNRRRLDAEEVRDAMLAVSGGLDRSVGGPHPFKPEIEWRYTQHNPFLADFETERRAVYLVQQRIRKQPFLEVFDGADPNAATGQRPLSTTALQALFLMNNPFAHRQAERFAERLLAEGATPRARIDRAHLLAYGRPATPDEVYAGEEYVQRCEEMLRAAGVASDRLVRAAWASYLRVVYSSNEFVFVD